MALKIGLVFVVWAAGTMAQRDRDRWYGTKGMTTEKPTSEYYPMKQGYGYGYENVFHQDNRDWERSATVDVRMAGQGATAKSCGKYNPHGKTRYGRKKAPSVNGYERKKLSRAAPYAEYNEAPKPKVESAPLASNAVPSCWEQHLLIGCNPSVSKHTGGGSYGGHGSTPFYYPTEPTYHDTSMVQYGPPQPPVYHGYEEHSAGYYPPSPPALPQPESKAPVMGDHANQGEFVPDSYYHYSPLPAAPYPSYEMYPPEHYPPPPPASEAYDGSATPPEGGSSYKTAKDDQGARFTAPVREKLSESPKAPVISAFRKPLSPEGANATMDATVPPQATGNGTVVDQGKTASTANPTPVLTTTGKPNEDDDAFWAVETNAESSTDAVESSTM